MMEKKRTFSWMLGWIVVTGATLSFLLVREVHSMVAGVDFGGEFFKIALVKPGSPFEIVTNVHSKRKTEAVVAFDGEERLYGADAAGVGVRQPHAIFEQSKKFLGVPAEHAEIVALQKEQYYPHDVITNVTRGSAAIKHKQKEEKVYHAEEIVAMIFSHARDITNAFAKGSVRDWVITVPNYFVESQRQAVIDAAELAGIRVLSLIDENTAAALQYGIERVYEEPFKVLFYNMGSTSTQVSIVEYSSYIVPAGFKKNKTVGTFDVLAKTWDASLGGSHFDLKIAEHFASEFNKKLKNGEDIRKVPRPMAKFLAQAKKTKIVLSANEAIPINMQSVHNDIDFFSHISRQQFEEMSVDLFERVLEPVKRAFQESGLQPSDINEVEIIGGGVRIPKIQQLLKDYLGGKTLSVHLNGDEGMALGSAFRAANISKSFRVRQVGMSDITPFSVGVRLVDIVPESDAEGKHWVKRASLFKTNNKLDSGKTVSFLHAKDVVAAFRYDNPSALPEGIGHIISRWNITGIEAFNEKMKDKNLGEPRVTLSFYLNANRMVQIASAEVSLEEELAPEPEVEKKDDDENKNVKGEKEEKENGAAQVEKKKAKKIIHRETLTVVRADKAHDPDGGMAMLPMSLKEKIESIDMLKELQKRDDARRDNAVAKNDFESFLYSASDKLAAEGISGVSTPEQVEEISKEVAANEDWLFDEGGDEIAAEYRKRLESMQTKLNLILGRLAETSARPSAVKKAREFIGETRGLMEKWANTMPQITEEERNAVVTKLEKLTKWLEDMSEKQALVPGYEAPVFSSSEVSERVKGINREVTILSRRPKPRVEKNVTQETASSNGTDETQNATDAETSVGEEEESQETNPSDGEEATLGSSKPAPRKDLKDESSTEELKDEL